MLLSYINMKLRDDYDSLDALCDDLGIDPPSSLHAWPPQALNIPPKTSDSGKWTLHSRHISTISTRLSEPPYSIPTAPSSSLPAQARARRV